MLGPLLNEFGTKVVERNSKFFLQSIVTTPHKYPSKLTTKTSCKNPNKKLLHFKNYTSSNSPSAPAPTPAHTYSTSLSSPPCVFLPVNYPLQPILPLMHPLNLPPLPLLPHLLFLLLLQIIECSLILPLILPQSLFNCPAISTASLYPPESGMGF